MKKGGMNREEMTYLMHLIALRLIGKISVVDQKSQDVVNQFINHLFKDLKRSIIYFDSIFDQIEVSISVNLRSIR